MSRPAASGAIVPPGLRLAARVARIIERARSSPPRAGRTRVIAIDGPSGSGKTTLAASVAEHLTTGDAGGPAPQVVHMDDLYPGWDGLAASVPRLVHEILDPLARGRDTVYRRWDWGAGCDGEPVEVPAADWLIVEGAGCGARAAAPYLACLVWLDAPAGLRRDRALARDGDTYAPHWDRWAAQEATHFAAEATADRADISLLA